MYVLNAILSRLDKEFWYKVDKEIKFEETSKNFNLILLLIIYYKFLESLLKHFETFF